MNDTTEQISGSAGEVDASKEPFGPDERITRIQAAGVLGITPRRVDQLRNEGELRTERNIHTGAVRFRFQDVADLRDRRAKEVEVR